MPDLIVLAGMLFFMAFTAAGVAILLLTDDAPVNYNGCGSMEAAIKYQERDTCYPYSALPVELRYYLDGAANTPPPARTLQ